MREVGSKEGQRERGGRGGEKEGREEGGGREGGKESREGRAGVREKGERGGRE